MAAGPAASGDIKVEKVDLSEDDEPGEGNSLDAALGQLAEYEGGYGTPAAAHGERVHTGYILDINLVQTGQYNTSTNQLQPVYFQSTPRVQQQYV